MTSPRHFRDINLGQRLYLEEHIEKFSFSNLISQTFKPYHFLNFSKSQTMSNLNSPTLKEVLGNIVVKVLGEREKKQENFETVIVVMVEEGEAKTFDSNKGVEVF